MSKRRRSGDSYDRRWHGSPPDRWFAGVGERSAIERCFGRVFRCFGPPRPPVCGWVAVVRRVALTDTAALVVAFATRRAGRPDRIRAPKRVLAHF